MQRIRLNKEPSLDAKCEAFWFQKEAFESIKDKEYAAVFLEQGLGKSKIAIDLILYWLERKIVDTVLVVAKKSLVSNWQRELRAHSHLQPSILSQDGRKNFYVLNGPTRLVLTHYEVLKSENERLLLFLRAREVAAILDESTKIKNPATGLSEAVHRLAPFFRKRVILTGTPVANRPYDIWSQVYFLDQGRSLGDDFSGFKKQVDLSSDLHESPTRRDVFEQELQAVFKRIRHFTVRKTKAQAHLDLPDKTVERILTDWESAQYDFYRQIRDETRAIVVRDGVPAEDDAELILKRLVRLVQVASNPRLISEHYDAVPGKFPYLHDIVHRVVTSGEKCIVWTAFTHNADWLANELRHVGTRRVHGRLPMDVRNRALQAFMGEDSVRVLIATPGAAKEGLTLTVANHVVFYDRTFSLDDYLQAQDRIHRISQTKPCRVYNLIMHDSIDEWIDVLLDAKRLAAQLAQGDISLDYYRSQMSYDFVSVVRDILGVDQEHTDRAGSGGIS
ncbi:MAG: DEAD/DEAH box helicase [Phycisphaerae bacterium]|nr:DEAD/DEAH box helicase [Phycisphaerae bacterium]